MVAAAYQSSRREGPRDVAFGRREGRVHALHVELGVEAGERLAEGSQFAGDDIGHVARGLAWNRPPFDQQAALAGDDVLGGSAVDDADV